MVVIKLVWKTELSFSLDTKIHLGTDVAVFDQLPFTLGNFSKFIS